MKGDHLEQLQAARDAGWWHAWAMRALLILGGAHFLAGVVFFFAYNWDDLPSAAKFGILQGAILCSFVAALLLRLERPAGQAMLVAATVFTGVLFAVIGQVYQTGADAWELFAAWTALTLPWALASRSSVHWLVWIVISLTASSLYGGQVLVALERLDGADLSAVIGVQALVYLVLREFALSKGIAWIGAAWFRWALAIIGMVALFGAALTFIFGTETGLPGFLAYLAAGATLIGVYLRRLPDFVIVSLAVGLTSLLAMAAGGRAIFEVFDSIGNPGELVLGLFLLGGWCVLVTTVVVRVLNRLQALAATGEAHG